ncbi:MAG TPA: M28 family peptidase [Flavobacteriales bacterium]
MRRIYPLLLCILLSTTSSFAQTSNADSSMIASIYYEILNHSQAYSNLQYLCKEIGNRFAGSTNADRAIEWGAEALRQTNADNVFLMPVNVPHWTRGRIEYGYFDSNGVRTSVQLTALGGSIGTDGKDLTAKVVMVKSFDELKQLGRKNIEGKIVFFNKGMDPFLINTGAAYGRAYPIRNNGAAEAARYGAVGCIIRSLTTAEDKFPHTGGMQYNDSIPKIPAAALSSVDAQALAAALKENPELTFTYYLSAQAFERRDQANVIAEIKGTEFPDKYIVVGGHLDSWDIGEGAHDDGTGIVQSIEIIRALKALGYKPKHTIRAVLFINEEFGNDGGETYARMAREKGEEHIAAIESDNGGFTPIGFNTDITDEQYAVLQRWLPLIEPYNLTRLRRGGSGVDISPLKNGKTALFGLWVDTNRYFDYHHSNNDVFENVNKRELDLGAAAMASLIYLIDQKGFE